MIMREKPMKPIAAQSQSEPWVLMWRSAVGRLTSRAWFPPAIAVEAEESDLREE